MRSFSVTEYDNQLTPMLRLAIPALAEEMLVLAVTWTDWWLAGHYFQHVGDATKAAMGTMAYVMWLIPCLFSTIAIGATAVIARRVGMRQFDQASIAANQSFLFGVLMSIFLTAALIVFGGDFLALMQLESDAANFALQYLEVVAPTMPLVAVSQIGAACLRGAGDTFTGFVIKCVVVVVNIVVSTMLVTGWGPIEAVGWRGIPIGTACGYSVGGLILLAVLLRGRAGLKLQLKEMLPNIAVIKDLFRIGLPGGIDMGALIACQLFFLGLINSLGKESAAAHGLAVQIEACAFLPGVAFQTAAATMAGQFLGANRPDRAMSGATICWLTGMAIMTSSGVVFWFFGEQVAWFFTGDLTDPTTMKTAELLKIVSLAMPSLSVVMIVSGAFRGAGDTIWPLIFTVFGFAVIRIPLAICLALDDLSIFGIEGVELVGLGIDGAWYAMLADILLRSLMILVRFKRGKWRDVQLGR